MAKHAKNKKKGFRFAFVYWQVPMRNIAVVVVFVAVGFCCRRC